MIAATDPLIAEIRRVVQSIALMSHGQTQSYNIVMLADEVPKAPPRWRLSDARAPVIPGARPAKGGGSSIPSGGAPVWDDRQVEYRQKSHVYFQKKLDRLARRSSSSSADLEALLKEATQALEDWRKTPVVAGVEPERGSFAWKCMVADDGRDVDVLKRTYTVSRATIYRYRAQYRGLRSFSAAA